MTFLYTDNSLSLIVYMTVGE